MGFGVGVGVMGVWEVSMGGIERGFGWVWEEEV